MKTRILALVALLLCFCGIAGAGSGSDFYQDAAKQADQRQRDREAIDYYFQKLGDRDHRTEINARVAAVEQAPLVIQGVSIDLVIEALSRLQRDATALRVELDALRGSSNKAAVERAEKALAGVEDTISKLMAHTRAAIEAK